MGNWLDEIPPLRQPRKPKQKAVPVPAWCKERYQQAHEQDFKVKYPAAYPEHYFKPVMPKQDTNGLQRSIISFLLWNGWRASRISSAGRYIEKIQKWIPGPTRSGSSDISATIKGRSVMFEAKVDLDSPGQDQLKEQEIECRAGGMYEFVKTFEEFLVIYDKIIKQ